MVFYHAGMIAYAQGEQAQAREYWCGPGSESLLGSVPAGSGTRRPRLAPTTLRTERERILSFVHLGYKHIVNAEALDHILFLLALAAIYRGRDWRDSLWVISAFTVGHSVTLALAATGEVLIPQRLTEFLIPLTIVARESRTSWCVPDACRPHAHAAGPSSPECSGWCTGPASPVICSSSSSVRS